MKQIRSFKGLNKLNETIWEGIEKRVRQVTGVVPCFCQIQNYTLHQKNETLFTNNTKEMCNMMNDLNNANYYLKKGISMSISVVCILFRYSLIAIAKGIGFETSTS